MNALNHGHVMLFVGGLHRSGTSPLFKALREHPSISGFSGTGVPEDEGQHLQSVYPAARDHGGPGRFGVDPRSHLTEASPLATAENAKTMFAAWRPYWDLTRPVLMEKSPPNLIMTRFLQAIFPHARILILLRHPLAVSLATQKRSNTSLDALLEHWVRSHQIFLEDAPRVSRLLVLSYESVLSQPSKAWDAIASLTGLHADGFSLNLESGFNDKYFERWHALPGEEREQLALKFGAAVARFGYSMRELAQDHVQPAFARALQAIG